MGRAAHNVRCAEKEGEYMCLIARESGQHTLARRSAKKQRRRSASLPQQRHPAS